MPPCQCCLPSPATLLQLSAPFLTPVFLISHCLSLLADMPHMFLIYHVSVTLLYEPELHMGTDVSLFHHCYTPGT